MDYMGGSINGVTPKLFILMGFSLINHPFWGTPNLPFVETPYGDIVAPQQAGAQVRMISVEAKVSLTTGRTSCWFSAMGLYSIRVRYVSSLKW